MTTELWDPLAGYAQRLHTVIGDEHHVASPLGAWLLLALCAPASTGASRDELAGILGMDAMRAATAAAALLDNPHPLVPSATAMWHRPGYDIGGLSRWKATLPRATEVGPLPDQASLDAWAREHTLGLIERFPLQMSPAVVLALASALATRVSWEEPFEVVPAGELGPHSSWAGRLTRALRTPEQGHTSYIATTERAGDVIVHVARAKSGRSRLDEAGLSVVSIAAAPDVKPADVLAAAYQLGPAAIGERPAGRRSLFDLPLGEDRLWTVREEPVLTRAADGREQQHRAVLPCWSATSDHDLSADELGFPAAAQVLATLLDTRLEFEARQTAMARYGRYGFEAAAVSGFLTIDSAPEPGVARIAELRFGHPYAVIAVATDTRYDTDRQRVVTGPWHGVPVFSAWVSEPEDVPAAKAGPR